jgi:hypothetical protein
MDSLARLDVDTDFPTDKDPIMDVGGAPIATGKVPMETSRSFDDLGDVLTRRIEWTKQLILEQIAPSFANLRQRAWKQAQMTTDGRHRSWQPPPRHSHNNTNENEENISSE